MGFESKRLRVHSGEGSPSRDGEGGAIGAHRQNGVEITAGEVIVKLAESLCWDAAPSPTSCPEELALRSGHPQTLRLWPDVQNAPLGKPSERLPDRSCPALG